MTSILIGAGMFFLPLIILILILIDLRKNARWPEEKRKLTDMIIVLCSVLGMGLVGITLFIMDLLSRQ